MTVRIIPHSLTAVDGGISRLVEDGDRVFVETWGPNRSYRGGATIDEIYKNLFALHLFVEE